MPDGHLPEPISQGHDAWGVLEPGDRAVAQRARLAIADAVDPPATPRGASKSRVPQTRRKPDDQ